MLKKSKSVFISPLLVIGVFAVCFALNGFFPFGKSSVSWCDMTQQVIPLLCDFKDILLGKEGFFLSLQNSGGMNFFGVFFFFLASPFSFLVVFFEKADIPLLMNIILVLKLALCAFSAAFYFNKRFSNLSFSFKTILSFCYALCGYGMMFYQNIIWLDVMYLFPFLMLGIHSLIENGKPWLFIFSLSFTVIVHFYIGYMVILFVILYFGVHAFFFKKIDYSLYVKLGISALVSMMLSAVVWLPSFVHYTSSGRKTNIINSLMYCDFFTHIDTCVPLLLATSLIFAVIAVFLPSLEHKKANTKVSVLLFIVMCIPVFIEPINHMWHTGDYMSFPIRYGFITIFTGLIACAELLSYIKCKKGKKIYEIIALTLSVIVGFFVLWFTNIHLEELSNYAKTLWGNEKSYFGILTLFLCLVFAEVPAIWLAKKNKVSKRALALILSVAVLCEAFVSLTIYVSPSKNNLDMNQYTGFCELEGKIKDDDFYRVNMSDDLIDANMTGAIGYNSLGHYTSLTDSNYMSAIKSLGYSGYWMEIGNWNGNVISDALMAVKYRIIRENGGYSIKENPFSLGFTAPSDSVLPQDIPKGDRAMVIGEIFKKMFSAENNPVTEYKATTFAGCNYSKDTGVHTLNRYGNNSSIVYQIQVEGEKILYFDCFNGGSNNLEEPVNNAFSVSVGGRSVSQSYPSQNQNGMLELGTFKDETVTVRLQLNKNVECYSFGVFGFDINAIRNALKGTENYKTDVKGSTITTEIPLDYSGEMFISLPYNKGYKVTLNGEKIEFKRCLTGFMSVNLESGGELKISFVPPKFVLGAIISVLGILAAIALYFFGKRIDLLPEVLKKSVFVLFLTVFAVFLIAIYMAPVVINLVS